MREEDWQQMTHLSLVREVFESLLRVQKETDHKKNGWHPTHMHGSHLLCSKSTVVWIETMPKVKENSDSSFAYFLHSRCTGRPHAGIEPTTFESSQMC